MATAAEIITRVRSLSEHELTELLSDADALALVNEVYADVWNLTDWPFVSAVVSRSTVGGQFTVPSDYRYVVALRDVDGNEVKALPFGQHARQLRSSESEYQVVGSTVTVFPAPADGTEYTLFYGKGPDILTESDSPEFPAEFHHALSYLAAGQVLRREADATKRADEYENKASTMIDTMRKVLFGPVTRPFVIGGRVASSVRLRGRR